MGQWQMLCKLFLIVGLVEGGHIATATSSGKQLQLNGWEVDSGG